MKRDLIIASAIVLGAFFALVCVFTAGFFMGRHTTPRAAGYSNRPGIFFGAAPRALGRFGALPRSRVVPSRRFPSRGKPTTGSLQRIDGQTLTLRTPRGITETVSVDNQTRIIRGLRPAALSDLKPGDRIIAIGQRNTQRQIIARTLIALDPSRQGSRDWRSEHPRPSRRSFPFRRFR